MAKWTSESGGGIWIYCPSCGAPIDQESYAAAVEQARINGAVLYRNVETVEQQAALEQGVTTLREALEATRDALSKRGWSVSVEPLKRIAYQRIVDALNGAPEPELLADPVGTVENSGSAANAAVLNTAMALLRDFHETAVRVIGRNGWQSGINRNELMECGRKYWKLRELIGEDPKLAPAGVPADSVDEESGDALLQFRMYVALKMLRAWNSGTEGYEPLTVFTVNEWIDRGMQGSIPWPNSPFFAEWAEKNGLSKIGESVGYKLSPIVPADSVESAASEVSIAETIAILAHFGQMSKYENQVIYLHHPAAVAAEVADEFKPIAWLHDVLEDCNFFTKEHLLAAGIDRKTVEAVEIITRDKSRESYVEFIDRIAASRNVVAITVKLADIRHNLRPSCPKHLAIRYRLAIPILEAALAGATASKQPAAETGSQTKENPGSEQLTPAGECGK